jgi:ATP-binding cassette subfamily B protein
VTPVGRRRMHGRARDTEALKAAQVAPGTWGRIWHFLRPYRGRLALYLGVILATAAIGSVPPLLVRQLLDQGVGHHDVSLVDALAAAMVGLALVNTALSLVNRWLGSAIGEGIIYDLRVALYEHVQRMPIAFFTRTQTGALMSRLTNDVLDAQNAVGTAASVLSDVFTLVATLIPMWVLSPAITGFALLVLPPFVVVDRVMAERISLLSRRQMQLNSDMSVTMTERFNVAGALLVKLFGRPHREAEEFARRAGAVRDTGVRLALFGRYLFAALSLVGAVGTAAVYWLGGREAATGHLAVGTVVALAAYVTRLYSPLTDLASTRVDVLAALVSFDRVFEVLDTPPAVADRPGAAELVPAGGRIEVRGVWFRYPAAADVSVASLERRSDPARPTDPAHPNDPARRSDPARPNDPAHPNHPARPKDPVAASGAALSTAPGPWVLEDLSFVAEPGTMTALVGPSGAGKTTLSSLLPRLYDVDRGAITIDGVDVRDVTQESLRQAIGVVSQDAHLFHDTIRHNLLYANPDATYAQVVDACRAARIHDLIAGLPEGYDTVVGERGYRLSGGEKQRLALARVFLKDPAIVILDEATAHLDSETELLVQQALAAALAGRTSVVIAHRLSTIQAADQIVVLDRGRIVARGTHLELVAAGGLYADLYRTQYLRGQEPLDVA